MWHDSAINAFAVTLLCQVGLGWPDITIVTIIVVIVIMAIVAFIMSIAVIGITTIAAMITI